MKEYAFTLGRTRYLNREQTGFRVQGEANQPAAVLRPIEVILREEGNITKDDLYYTETVTDCGGGLFRRCFRLVNYGDCAFEAQLVLPLDTCYRPGHWLIPGVMYNGNPFGEKDSPKGMTRSGVPWVFSYDHSTLPACTLTETGDTVVAVFADEDHRDSLQCACSLEEKADGTVIHKLIYPIVEEPVTYAGKNEIAPPLYTWLSFAPGTAFEAHSYLFAGTPPYENYGFLPLLSRAIHLFRNDYLPAMDFAMAREMALQNIQLGIDLGRESGQIGVRARDYTHPIGNHHKGEEWEGLTLKMIEENPSLNRMLIRAHNTEMGFSSQAFLQCRMLMKRALEAGDEEAFRYLDGYLGKWLSTQRENGMISVSWPQPREIADVTNLGWGVSEAVQIYRLLSAHGRDGEKYLSFARRLCDFFCAHYDETHLFGQRWSMEGECVATSGSGGGFVLKGMAELAEVTGEEKYLLGAKRAMQGYFSRDLDHFLCTAGAIDCVSVDKESAFPFLGAAITLYRLTQDALYLACARKTAAYFLSWMMVYECRYDAPCDFTRLGYRTAGGTVVSAEHQCIDPYAAVIPAHLMDLYRLDGNPLWREAAELIWRNALQCIAGPKGMMLHGMKRLPGMQNECFAQTRWTKYRSTPDQRGHLNDYIGSWLSAFRLYTLERLERDHPDFLRE